jgi:hypothetical protein
MAIEEPSYEAVEKDGNLEVRLYSPYLVAETQLASRDGDNSAFRRLADYIFGNNLGTKKMEMTAPVETSTKPAEASVKIEMTAPVARSEIQGQLWMSFSMPRQFTRETLPIPKDSQIRIREIPTQRRAVIKYSGRWSDANYQENLDILKQWIAKKGLKPKGSPILARYNPPWTPWFLRRNEIHFEVELSEPSKK